MMNKFTSIRIDFSGCSYETIFKFGFRKGRGVSSLHTQLTAYQEILCLILLITYLI